MRLLLFALALLPAGIASTRSALAAQGLVTVAIDSPTAGSSVAGTVSVTGNSTGLVNGRVVISVDGGPFQLATGQGAWFFQWDTTGLTDGQHTLTARARECFGCTPAFDTVLVEVRNAGALLVEVVTPAPGSTQFGSIVAAGVSAGADSVSISVDGGPFLASSGLPNWSLVLPALAAGPHSLRARATGRGVEVMDEVAFLVGDAPLGESNLTYVSSVDGAALTSRLYLPSDFDAAGPARALVCHLHGAGGAGRISAAMEAELDARGWIGVAPDGRSWEDAGLSCTWPFSPAYFDSPDPLVGPSEQDIFDLLDWVAAELPVDLERVYLTGFSYGGRGTYIIGLKNPDRFAAIAPMGAPSDMYEIDVRRPDSDGCRAALLGGVPGDSPEIDTRFTVTSARFLLENAFNLPLFNGHGLFDDVASNDPAVAPFLHGWHMTSDTSWSGCHGTTDLCFGHTPTLSELAARHPGAYDWAYMFTPVGHVTDPRWLRGTPAAGGLFGTADPLDPSQLLGIYDFFERRSLVHSPETVVFKTYERDHRRAYWLELETANPWEDVPAGVRARRDSAANALHVELVRATSLRIDVAAAGLDLVVDRPLDVTLDRLSDAVYDPALDDPLGVLEPTLVLAGLTDVVGATVLLDGAPLPPTLVSVHQGELSIGPIEINRTRSLQIHAYVKGCPGAPNSLGSEAVLRAEGTSVLGRNDLVLMAEGLPPMQFGLVFYGFGGAGLPLGDGTLCIAAPLYRLPALPSVDGSGEARLAIDLSLPPAASGAGAIEAGDLARFQMWYRDPFGQTGSNTTSSLELRFR